MKHQTGASTAAHRTSTRAAHSGAVPALPTTTPGCHGRPAGRGADDENWHKPVRAAVLR
jgi:hypothetical protein